MADSRRRRGHAAAAVLAVLFSSRASVAFLPPPPLCVTHGHAHLGLHVKKPANRSKSKAGGRVGARGGGFGSATATPGAAAAVPVDRAQVRAVAGYTGSGTKALAAAANEFDRLRKACGKDAAADVYVRSPKNDARVFWFVGKVARTIEVVGNDAAPSDGPVRLAGTVYPTEEEAVVCQKRLILEYAKNQLRPQNLGGPYAQDLELWTAPGDSEMDVVQNKVTLVRIAGSTACLREGFNVNDTGFSPEIYVGDERKEGGLRVVRDAEGRPVKPAFDIE